MESVTHLPPPPPPPGMKLPHGWEPPTSHSFSTGIVYTGVHDDDPYTSPALQEAVKLMDAGQLPDTEPGGSTWHVRGLSDAVLRDPYHVPDFLLPGYQVETADYIAVSKTIPAMIAERVPIDAYGGPIHDPAGWPVLYVRWRQAIIEPEYKAHQRALGRAITAHRKLLLELEGLERRILAYICSSCAKVAPGEVARFKVAYGPADWGHRQLCDRCRRAEYRAWLQEEPGNPPGEHNAAGLAMLQRLAELKDVRQPDPSAAQVTEPALR